MLRSVGALLAIAVVTTLQGCSDPEAPRHPIVGTYAVETTLESFTQPKYCPGQMYCYEQISPNGATLSGTLYVADTLEASAEFERHDPYFGQEGRVTVSGPFWVLVDPMMIGLREQAQIPTTYVALTDGVFEGDSIVGEVSWQVNGHRYYYSGTFVARRITGR